MKIDLKYEDFGSLVLEFKSVVYSEEVPREESPIQPA